MNSDLRFDNYTNPHRHDFDPSRKEFYDYQLAVWADDGGALPIPKDNKSNIRQSERQRRYQTRQRRRLALFSGSVGNS